jgi:hypothetical protein
MPLFFFHLHDELDASDREGTMLSNLDAARRLAVTAARDLVAVGAQDGTVDLSHWIEVQDEAGNEVFRVRFCDSVTWVGASEFWASRLN